MWVTDWEGNEAGTKGHQVIKFSPEGEELMRLGEAGGWRAAAPASSTSRAT